MVSLVAILAVAVALLALLVAGLLRSHAEILRALDSLGVRLDPETPSERVPPQRPASPTGLRGAEGAAAAVDVAGTDPSGAAVSLAVTGVGHRTLLAFLSSTCLTCRGFWKAFGDRRLRVPGGARLVIVTKGPEAESPATIRRLAPRGVHTLLSSDAWRDYRIPVAPYFVLVDGATGRIAGEGAAATWEQVCDLMDQAIVDVDDDGRPVYGRPQDRAERVDRELRAARIEPEHPSLYPERDR